MQRILGIVVAVIAAIGVRILFAEGIIPSPFPSPMNDREAFAEAFVEEAAWPPVMRDEFPEAFEAFLHRTYDQAPNGAVAVETEAARAMTEFRVANADLMLSASPEATSALMAATRNTHMVVQTELGEEACGKFATEGPLALGRALARPRVETALDDQTATLIKALGSGKDADPIAPPTEEDWAVVLERDSRTEAELRQFEIVGAADPSADGYCDALIAFFDLMARSGGEAGARTRAALARDLAAG
jgi:hypothetical protein